MMLETLSPPLMRERAVYLEILKKCYLARLFDQKALLLSKQNLGGNFHLSNKGHELIGAVGGVFLQGEAHFGLPYYRDRGFAIGKGVDAKELMAAFLAKGVATHSGGRMMPEHYSDKRIGIPCQSSVVGSQLLQAVGLAKGIHLQKKEGYVYVSIGDGAASQGDFHETLNFSALHKLRLIVVVQDNGYAISVPKAEQTAGGDIGKWGEGYKGLEVHRIDGCSLEEVCTAYEKALSYNGPTLIVAKVPRLGPHSSSDDPTKYKTLEECREEERLDPIPRVEKELLEKGILTEEEKESLYQEALDEITAAAQFAIEAPLSEKVSEKDLFYERRISKVVKSASQEVVTMATAINHALHEIMEEERGAVVFGQDVAHKKGGVFCITEGLTERFGERCFNTPLAESTIMGLALGLALDGFHKPIAEIQFADYIWTGVNQLFNEIASYFFRSNGMWHLPLIIRMPCGGYIQGGPYHSQSIEAILAHIPGLKVVYPSNAEDAKRLFKASFLDPNPVLFLEHKALYRQRVFSARREPLREEILPLGEANVVQEGSDITLVTWGMGVFLAAQVLPDLPFSVELIDLRTIHPLDLDTIILSVKKTSKLLIFHEAPRRCGFGAEIAAEIGEKVFTYLDAPIVRLAGKNLPVPYAKALEEAVLPQKEDLRKALEALYRY